MSAKDIRRVSLADLKQMDLDGKLFATRADAETVDLGAGFWEDAEVVDYSTPATSVHLRLDPEVFAFFKAQGKGHLTRMQNVLKAYVKALGESR